MEKTAEELANEEGIPVKKPRQRRGGKKPPKGGWPEAQEQQNEEAALATGSYDLQPAASEKETRFTPGNGLLEPEDADEESEEVKEMFREIDADLDFVEEGITRIEAAVHEALNPAPESEGGEEVEKIDPDRVKSVAQQIVLFYVEDGMSIAEIAKFLGKRYQHVYNTLKQKGVLAKKQADQALEGAAADELPESESAE